MSYLTGVAPRGVPHTLDQIPKDAATYYRQSLDSALYGYDYRGRDDCGRRVYWRTIDGERVGLEPCALLTFREFRAAVQEAAKRCSSIGVQRWTRPTYSDCRDLDTV